MTEHPIPLITDEMGRYWRQPPRESILVDDTHALMSRPTFELLHKYSASIPSGVYPGKMWRAEYPAGWYLNWFTSHPSMQGHCLIKFRSILLLEETGGH